MNKQVSKGRKSSPVSATRISSESPLADLVAAGDAQLQASQFLLDQAKKMLGITNEAIKELASANFAIAEALRSVRSSDNAKLFETIVAAVQPGVLNLLREVADADKAEPNRTFAIKGDFFRNWLPPHRASSAMGLLCRLNFLTRINEGEYKITKLGHNFATKWTKYRQKS